MSKIKLNKQWLFLLSAAVVVALLVMFFAKIFVYIILALILSVIGKPIVNFLNKKIKLSITLSSAITLSLFLSLLYLFVRFIVPFIIQQAGTLAQIDFVGLYDELALALQPLQEQLWQFGIMNTDTTIVDAALKNIQALIGAINIEYFFTDIVGVITTLFIGIFAVSFITFFFLKDKGLFHRIFMLLIPDTYMVHAENIFNNSNRMLKRYFTGLITDIVCFMTIVCICLALCGVENAILLAFIGSIFNIIPYIGPLIGVSLATIIAYVSALSGGYSPELIWIVVKVVACFIGCNMLDAFFMQPYIYSNSVKAHPLEIFLVILLSGQLLGAIGMMFAIPLYTIVRIIAKEFFNQSKLVNKITEQL
ncbi:AI-2E family transporter [Bacteroidia bacterium]|nr:AI-2E family transporter [Bacteroidia bacterium]